jgi:CheY-like chemotaxis protein
MSQLGIKRQKLFLVEDNKTVNKVLTDVLTRKGYEVVSSFDGSEALAKLSEHHPDCIITDYEMPNMDGLQFVQLLRGRQELNAVPIIMLTAKDDPANILMGIKAGADDYLSKKVAVDVLAVKVEALLRLKDLREKAIDLERLTTLKEMIVTYNHQINNPLTILFGYSDFLSRVATPEQTPIIQKMNDQLKRLRDIVKQLSDLQKTTDSSQVKSEVYSENATMISLKPTQGAA